MSTSPCTRCPFQGRPRVGPSGDPSTCKYALIGEAPAYDEIRKGQPFVGKTGRLLMAFLQRVGISRGECYITNALKCQIPRGVSKDSAKLKQALFCCRHFLAEELKQVNEGATIAAMGVLAKKAIWPKDSAGILASRGWRKLGHRDVYVMAHPAYYNYNPDEAPMLVIDLQRLKRGRLPQIGPFEFAKREWIPVLEGPEGSLKEQWTEVTTREEVMRRSYHWVTPEGARYVAFVLREKCDVEDLLSMLHQRPMEARSFIAFDLETDQVDFMRDRILCMSISVDPGTAFIIPDSLLYEDAHEFVTRGWSAAKWRYFMEDFRYYTGAYLRPNLSTVALLRELFAIPGYRWVGHNAKFDLRFLQGQLGVVNARCDFDTIVAHYTLDERKGGHALKPLADDFFDSGDYEADLFRYITKKSSRYSMVPRKVLYRYNAMDTELTLRLAYKLEAELERQGLYERPYLFPMMEAYPMLLKAELQGVGIDWEEFERIDREEIQPELDRLRAELREISGHPDLNPLSSKRVNDIIYDELGFPIIEVRTRAAGKRIKARSSQQAVIDGWSKLWQLGQLPVSEHAWSFVEKLKEYRHLRKMRGSYIRKWVKFRGTDDRVHTSFLLRGTVTGRLSSKDPPMQTIPSKIKEKWSLLVANAHIPRPGWKMVYADYSQAELRVAACLARDDFMISSFLKEDADYHSEVARAAFGDNFTHDDRQHSKRLTFGWLFGGNVYEIALNALQYEGPVAQRFAEEWDRIFYRVVEYRNAQGRLMREQGYVESIFGRRRRQLLLTRDNVGKAMRIAANSPIQSASSDLTLISATRLYRQFQGVDWAYVILLIHDAIVMEVQDEEDHVEVVSKAMQETMVSTAAEFFPAVPFKADVKVTGHLGEVT